MRVIEHSSLFRSERGGYMPAHLMDLTGQRYGRLTVIERDYSKKTTAWKCRCDCGNYVVVTSKNLRQKGFSTKSCGCLNREGNPTHRHSRERIYHIWMGMRRRCYNEKDTEKYKRYGGRGIIVCKEWDCKDGFMNFYNWSMANGYRDDLTIDRIDNNGNYEPSNCRWITPKEQQKNTRWSVLVFVDGKTYSMREFTQIANMERRTIYGRIEKNLPMLTEKDKERLGIKSIQIKRRGIIYGNK